MSRIHEIVNPWLENDNSDDLARLKDDLVWLQDLLYKEYEPCAYQTFDDRIESWLRNLDDEADQQSMFRLLRHLFFVGRPQFESLCRASFNDTINRWIVDQASIDILKPALARYIDNEIGHTWFCPITDSMRINAFLKINNLKGHSHRPDWRSLAKLACPIKVRLFVSQFNVKRIVLLEDFVGTGEQMAETVTWAAQALPDIPVLVIPLVCCPEGVKTGAHITEKFANVSFKPTLSLSTELFLKKGEVEGEPATFGTARALIEKIKDRWTAQAFGYGETGAIVASYSNCPDNTLPMIHEESESWAALFPRITRN
jgi:hypothetical protein